jgi:serine O-acetyltransferase
MIAYLLTPIELSIKILTKNEILTRNPLGGGIYLADRGHIMLGADCVGPGCVIHHNVTVGIDIATGGVPQIGANVWIGPDSLVFGAIRIGDGCTLLPGSVLTKSVPARTVVQGNPARVVRRDFDNSHLLAQRDPDAGVGMPASQAAG